MMKKLALILSFIFYELTAIENMTKYLIPATFIGCITTYYCHQKWLSSAEYLAFVKMKNTLKELGIFVKITTNRVTYSTSKSMSLAEFEHWIDEYELAQNKAINLWAVADLVMGLGTLGAFFGILILFFDIKNF